MRKICIVVTNRASYGRLKSVIKAVKEHPNLQLQLISAVSAYDLPIEPDYRIQCLIDGDDTNAMSITTGVFLTQLSVVLQNLNPDIVYLHGDRFETLAIAIASSYQNIKLAHGEGGEETGTIDNKARNAISLLSDIHFPVTSQSKQKLLKMGCKNIYKVGSTALDSLIGIDLTRDRKEPYIVVLQHPNTTDPEPLQPLIEALQKIPLQKVWINPNVDSGSREILKLIHKQDIDFIKNLPPEEYARLLKNCICAVGNSSSFIKEGSFLGVPAVLVGNRQQNREVGLNVMRVNNDSKEIEQAIKFQILSEYKPSNYFGDGTASQKIVKILSEVTL